MNIYFKIFQPPRPIPDQYRQNFIHLFGDIVWFGVLNGSTIAFLSVYATRIGASGDQVGWLGAVGALANLIFTLPAGFLLARGSISRSVMLSALLNRIFYAGIFIIPSLFVPQEQIWLLILISFIMSVPLTGVLVGFNALFAEAVPVEWRGYVASIRNALISLASMATTFLCGQVLNTFGIPVGYQIVFFIGFLGGLFSTYHLSKVKSLPAATGEGQGNEILQSVGSRMQQWLRLDVLTANFKRVLVLLFGFHLFQYLVIPLFPLYTVNILGYSDQTISWGTAGFQLMVFLLSSQLSRFTRRLNNQTLTGIGMILMVEFPALLPLAKSMGLYLLVTVLSGVGWAIVGSTIYNYLLDRLPENDRPAHLSWYNLAMNAAVLVGSLGGPIIAGWIGYDTALWVFAFGRLLAGIAILLWG